MTFYPPSLDVRPLTSWPGTLTAAPARRRAIFTAPLGTTLNVLDHELRRLAARHPVLEVAIPADQFRIDGRPRASAREVHPGVVLSLPTTSVGALRYATDVFDRWQDNLRAIALGLEALRKVDRYGITKRGEQYAGFKALPAATATGGKLSEAEALAVLRAAAELPPGNEFADRALLRAARARTHPDRHGGDDTAWRRVEAAAERLGWLA